MKINRNNYEEFFLDYMDGTLSPQQVAVLMLFLEQNQDLKEEFENMESFTLVPEEEITYTAKNDLKKTYSTTIINSTNYTEYLIASIEGDLNETEKYALHSFVTNNKAIEKELNLYKSTKLIPNTNVVFKNKQKLKHLSLGALRPLYYFVAAAASIAILLGLFILFNQTSSKNRGKQFAQKITIHKIKESKENIISEKTTSPCQITPNHQEKSAYTNVAIIKNEEKNNRLEKENIESINAIKIQNLAENKKINLPKQLLTHPEIVRFNNNNEEIADAKHKNSNAVYYTLSKLFNNSVKDILRDKNFGGELASYRKKLNFYELAYWSTQGYNKVFHKNVGVNREYDNTGDLVAFNVKSESVEFSKKFDK